MVAEVMGHRFHCTALDLQRDAQRRNELQATGLDVLEFTGRRHRPRARRRARHAPPSPELTACVTRIRDMLSISRSTSGGRTADDASRSTGSSRSPTTSARPTSATRSPRAPSRRSTSSSTRSASQPGQRVLDVGCGPGRHAHELARRGIAVHGVDISHRFVDLARARRPAGRHLRAARRPRACRSTPSSTPPSRCARARFGLVTGDGEDDARPAPAWPGRCGPAGGSRSARSTPTSRSATRATATFDAATGVNHERTEVRDEAGERQGGRPVDPLLHARPSCAPSSPTPACASTPSGRSSPGAYRAAAADRRHGRVPGRRHARP